MHNANVAKQTMTPTRRSVAPCCGTNCVKAAIIEWVKGSVNSRYTVNVAEASVLTGTLCQGCFCCAMASNPKANIIDGKHAGLFIQRYQGLTYSFETIERRMVPANWEMTLARPPIHMNAVIKDLDFSQFCLYHLI